MMAAQDCTFSTADGSGIEKPNKIATSVDTTVIQPPQTDPVCVTQTVPGSALQTASGHAFMSDSTDSMPPSQRSHSNGRSRNLEFMKQFKHFLKGECGNSEGISDESISDESKSDVSRSEDEDFLTQSCSYSSTYLKPSPPPPWQPPEMVDPDEGSDKMEVDLGVMENHDAELYHLIEKMENGKIQEHSFVRMPSVAPGSQGPPAESVFNIAMIDVSASMDSFWTELLFGWNQFIMPVLKGRTLIYAFGTEVQFKRSGTDLQNSDFDGSGTNLSGALQTIVEEVYKCKERYIKVFLITDGFHNANQVQPTTIIDKLVAPRNKVCDVHILGAGKSFPVQYSIEIRSRLHSGSSNLPTLFWANSCQTIEQKLKEIKDNILGGTSQTIDIDIPGWKLPGLPPQNKFHLSEWAYFPHGPKMLEELNIIIDNLHRAKIKLESSPSKMEIFLEEIFRQWNSIVIQLNNKKEVVPGEVLLLMDRIFKSEMDCLLVEGPQSIRQRLCRKKMSTYETDYKTIINQIKVILTTEKFANELDLAESILTTTVTSSKYETKNLRMKGHLASDFENDCKEFLVIYNEKKQAIQTISITPDDCCRVTMGSTVTDLQDPDFQLLLELNKFEFLKQFNITGIPIFAPTRDSVQINPWSLCIERILNSPYTVMSQVSMESFPESLGPIHKDVKLRENDENTHFNAIVPIFPPTAVPVMKSIVKTKLYALCATFAILKTPHIVDFNVHMAALGVTWINILKEHAKTPRPEFVNQRIESIDTTAELYMDRTSFANYLTVLKDNSAQALMTESVLRIKEKTVKCETLVKSLFFLHLAQKYNHISNPEIIKNILRFILLEYIGRCLSNYKVSNEVKSDNKSKANSPFTDFFAEALIDPDQMKDWMSGFASDVRQQITDKDLLSKFYYIDELKKKARKVTDELIMLKKESLLSQIPIKVAMNKVQKLTNKATCGDISWMTLKIFATEAGLNQTTIDDLFSEQSVFIYTAHALQYRSSRERLGTPLVSYDKSKVFVQNKVNEENTRVMNKNLSCEIVQSLIEEWRTEYFLAHREIVEPMTVPHIVREAQKLGIDVREDTFNNVYLKYRPQTGLLSNACQSKTCPFFLKPNKRYNQHSSAERVGVDYVFPHGFHRVACMFRDKDLPLVMSELSSGTHTKKGVPLQILLKINTTEMAKLISLYSDINMDKG